MNGVCVDDRETVVIQMLIMPKTRGYVVLVDEKDAQEPRSHYETQKSYAFSTKAQALKFIEVQLP